MGKKRVAACWGVRTACEQRKSRRGCGRAGFVNHQKQEVTGRCEENTDFDEEREPVLRSPASEM